MDEEEFYNLLDKEELNDYFETLEEQEKNNSIYCKKENKEL